MKGIIRGLVLAEQLAGGKPFEELTPEELFCGILSSRKGTRITPDQLNDHTQELIELQHVLQDVASLSTPYEQQEQTATQGEEKATRYGLSSLLASLVIQGGISPEYLLDRAELWELPLYAKALAEHNTDKAAANRLTHFFLLAPHTAGKIKTPQELYSLPNDTTPTQPATHKSALQDADVLQWLNDNAKG